MQRTHPEDLSGYLQKVEPDEWEVLSLPAIREDEEGNKSALCPRIHTLEELYKLKRVNESVFDRQYMQDPRPKEGLLFHSSELQFYDGSQFDPFSEEVEGITSFIDTADEGEDSLSMPTGFNIGPTIYIHSVVFTKEGSETTPQLCANELNKYKPEYCRVESNFGGTMYLNLLDPLIGGHTSLLPVRAKGNKAKHTRILMMSGFIKEHVRFRSDPDRGEEYDKFMDELTAYLKNGKVDHDDAPDSVAGLTAMIKRFLSHLYEAHYFEEDDGYSE